MGHPRIAIASQAIPIDRYKSIKEKVFKYNADIYINKQCLYKNITPNYANIKIPNSSPAAHFTKERPKAKRSSCN